MTTTVFPAHDGNYLARCLMTGSVVSGRDREYALKNLNSSACAASLNRQTKAVAFVSCATAPNFERGGSDE